MQYERLQNLILDFFVRRKFIPQKMPGRRVRRFDDGNECLSDPVIQSRIAIRQRPRSSVLWKLNCILRSGRAREPTSKIRGIDPLDPGPQFIPVGKIIVARVFLIFVLHNRLMPRRSSVAAKSIRVFCFSRLDLGANDIVLVFGNRPEIVSLARFNCIVSFFDSAELPRSSFVVDLQESLCGMQPSNMN